MRHTVFAGYFAGAVFVAAGFLACLVPENASAQYPPVPTATGAPPPPTSPFYTNDPVPPNLSDISTRSCHNANDCVTVAMSPCGAPIAINRHYVYAIQGWNQYMYPRMSCNVYKQNALLTPICQSGVCALTNYYSPNAAALRERQIANPAYCDSVNDCGVAVDACGRKTAINLGHLAALQAANPANGVCTSVSETRPVKQKDCQNNTCVVYLDNSPTTQESPAVAEAPPAPEEQPPEQTPAVAISP